MITCLSQFYHHFKDKPPANSQQVQNYYTPSEDTIYLGKISLSGQEPPKDGPVEIVISKKSSINQKAMEVILTNFNMF